MTKQEAADYLGISSRMLEKHVKDKKLGVRYEGQRAMFDDGEVESLKQRLDALRTSKAAVYSAPQPQPETGKNLLQAGSAGLPTVLTNTRRRVPDISPDDLSAALVNLLQRPTVPVADKLLLTLEDCQHMTGLSRDYLRKAIADGTLTAKQIGRGWKVKRSDLDAYIARL
jgi:excisionase family DNA binding protein